MTVTQPHEPTEDMIRRLGDLEIAVLEGTASTSDHLEYQRLAGWHDEWLHAQPGMAEQDAAMAEAVAAAFGMTADDLAAEMDARREQARADRAATIGALEWQLESEQD